MNKIYLSIYVNLLFSTFSIVAVDTITNQVGSAGASCIGNSVIISDIHPNLGAIHTQSYWMAANQNYASSLMAQGFSQMKSLHYLKKMMFRIILQLDNMG